MLTDYCRQQPVPDDWHENVHSLLGVPRKDGVSLHI